ncbi:MAG: formate dehydrogenase accessory sulfurtransferase FdhD [Planctomycetota bacterium]|jgi:FdhD protein
MPWGSLTEPQQRCQVSRWTRVGGLQTDSDELAAEEPLEIRVRGRSFAVTMRTPGHDKELAAGLLLSEGIVSGPADILRIETCARNDHDNAIAVTLAPKVAIDLDQFKRHLVGTSSCGVCGKTSIEAVHRQFAPVESPIRVSAAALLAAPRLLRPAQATFGRTGGLHAAAIFDAGGHLVVVHEDIGRHNAVDKVLGHALLNDGLPLDEHALLVSGRASFEIMQKALAARISIVAAVSAPSSLAVQFAEQSGQTLVGFLRDDRMNIYAQPDRIDWNGAVGVTTPRALPSRGPGGPDR